MAKKKKVFKFQLNTGEDVPKFRQLIDSVNHAISENRLSVGDHLPSVNQICKEYSLSRDTVFKAYSILKEQGVIDSVPNKGYFVAREVRRVFLFLDTFKAYKEVLYDSFTKNLPTNVMADVHFHHYNIDVFRRQIEESIGKYSKYVVMPFDAPEMHQILEMIPSEKLLIVDWNIYSKPTSNMLYQDFGQSVFEGLQSVSHLIKKYREAVFLYPDYTNHPYESVEYFSKYCIENNIPYVVSRDPETFEVRDGVVYFSVSDRMLGKFLDQCREKKLEPGVNTGIISYNETPMKKFIYKGITVITTDFKLMGQKAAEFVSGDTTMQYCVPTRVLVRESL
ncbi:GntR family transcriptional regulator [Natronoflexus pectinivorans]|uniref:DNA-binding transcriptional regulator YhcF (GntR family) n=1 Tax=Natronoflexus pectinivorans TaxID=682526 RepID=A0A4R2G5X7_9BACT|nr:GntR family transcriptional regulator [Natronoflexus pectinivorans]TCO03013.1 DNA-binding transcriptional regulator YhcF (GntR family) [Natronoflexus pectinivorans]